MGIFLPCPVRGKLIRRYKRFLVDVESDTGEFFTAHLANTGSMKSLLLPEARVWCSRSNDPKRKLKFSVQILELPGTLALVNTHLPNRIVRAAIEKGLVAELGQPSEIRAEVSYGTRSSRVDLLVDNALVEIKNVSLLHDDGKLRFPDAVTTRGQKHLAELADAARSGQRAFMFYLLSRSDGAGFGVAGDIDPVYEKALRKARKAGVEVIAYRLNICPEQEGVLLELGERVSLEE